MDMNGETDDYITIDLQPRAAVIDRLTVLRALVERSLLETVAEQEGLTDEIEERRFDLLAEVLSSSAGSALTPEELRLMQTPIGQIPEDETTPMLLAAEAFGAIGHACGLIHELPLPPTPVGGSEELLELILSMSVEDIESRLTLPSEEEAAQLLEVIEIVHWRVDVEFGARLDGGELTPEEVESIASVSKEAELSGLFQVYPSGDLRIGNKPVRKWTDEEVEMFYVVSLQQRDALSWLCSNGQDWTVISDEEE
jgi:hypothetical protein